MTLSSSARSRDFSKRAIAARYLPSRPHYWYALAKLATDPLYGAVRRVFEQTQAPLLDLGCGIGLLPQCLRASGFDFEYRGTDIDAGKIDIARAAASKGGLQGLSFEAGDLSMQFPDHRGSVALLDVLQYFDAAARDELVHKAARCISSTGRLIIRAGLDDRNWRAAITRGADRIGHLTRWMQTPPRSQPSRADLQKLLASHGLECEFQPLSGNLPFNNWLIMGRMASA